MDILRFATAGSVDDGKSTLIGRLLYDTQDGLRRPDRRRRDGEPASGATSTSTWRCSPTACGPSASRASRSTWPTATSPRRKRKFIIADTPGHMQYTRNMVTGASTADLALVLVDARKGIVEQSRRHAFLATLLQVPHIVLCVNKMDLVDYSEEVYRARSTRSSPPSPRSSDPRPHGRSRSRRSTATTSSRGRRTCPGTTARACCTTWRTSTSRATATSSTCGSRCSTSSVRSPTTGTTTAATPAGRRRVDPQGRRRHGAAVRLHEQDQVGRDGRRRGRRGVPARCR